MNLEHIMLLEKAEQNSDNNKYKMSEIKFPMKITGPKYMRLPT